MPHSLPSDEIYIVDVPEVKNFEAKFEYNFFVPDEQINETSKVPDRIRNKKSNDHEANYVKYIETRTPRYVKFTWLNSKMNNPGNQVIESDIRKNTLRSQHSNTLIVDNYNKIISEDHISSQNYIDVMFNDSDIDNKIYSLVSGSYEALTSDDSKQSGTGYGMAAARAHSLMPKDIDPGFVTEAMVQPLIAYGANHYGKQESHAHNRTPIKNNSLTQLKNSFVNTQINSKLLHDITSRSVNDPFSPYSMDMRDLQKNAKKTKSSINKNQNIHESKFKTTVPYIKLRIDKTSYHSQRTMSEIVGYVIDKYEVTSDGTLNKLKPIIIENEYAVNAYDDAIKYNQTYSYSIRTIVLFNLPAIDYDTGDIATIQVLVSSKPTKQYVSIIDTRAPPPPADTNFTWNYELEKLLIHWCFPTNSQRDIKRFQVFRRKNTNEPFELLKEYDFDDSMVRSPQREYPARRCVERITNPITFYTDDDFTKESKYIYALCSIDAHGLSSCYGEQFELSFDKFKNQLTKSLISHSGAPKPYPNLYLEGEGFVDVANVGGNHSKRMQIYFVPQFYHLLDEHNREHRVITTNQTNGVYKIQFLNTDNQKSETLTIRIDDRISDK